MWRDTQKRVMPQPLHTRFAPTPSGYLHVGNAFSFVLTWLYARKSGGTIRLRIDDIDGVRARPEFVADIFESLNWLGLDYDTGPQSVDDFYQNHSQHLRLERYNHFLKELEEKHLLFACNCSRKQVIENAVDGQYNGHCLQFNLPFDTPEAALRIITPQGQSTITFTDVWNDFGPVDLYQHLRHFVVRGKNGVVAYQLASLVDDVDFGINFIVRGQDLLHSTAAQCFIAQNIPALSGFSQTQFLHHPLFKNTEGEKLSKSLGATALRERRLNGETPEKFYLELSVILGLPECISANEMLEVFDGDSAPSLRMP